MSAARPICRTPLHEASLHGNVDVSLSLIDRGADVNAHNRDGVTPLHLACAFASADMVRALIDRGADMRIVITKTSLFASRMRCVISLSVSLSLNCISSEGATPLHVACAFGRTHAVRALLDCGADVHAKATFLHTPLHLASACGNTDIICALIHHGANIHDRTKVDGYTPLHTACRERHIAAAVTLMELGADVHARTGAGFTCLHLALQTMHVDMAIALIDHGANVHCTDSFNRTAASYCDARAMERILEYMHACTTRSFVRQL